MEKKLENYYNTERKLRYIESVENEGSKRMLKSLFRQTADYEEELDLDIADFRLPDFIRLFEERQWNVTSTFIAYRWTISNYINWCIICGYCDAASNQVQYLQPQHLSSLALSDGGIRDLETLTSILDVCYEDCDEKPDPCYIMHRTIWYLAWFGFTKEECRLIRKDELVDDGIVTPNYEVHGVPENVMRVWRAASQIESFEFHQYINGQIRTMTRRFIPTDYLLRSLESGRENRDGLLSVGSIDNWTAILKKIERQKGITQKISINKLNRYGRFAMMYQWECDNEPITNENYVQWKSVMRQYQGRASSAQNVSVLLRTYKEWKKAFYPEKML